MFLAETCRVGKILFAFNYQRKEKTMKKVFFILAISILLVACGGSNGNDLDTAEIEQMCVDGGGTFVSEYNECEFISEDICTEMGGEFDECASACRHEEGSVACTANCVPLCTFE
jgi:hypothetical protein